MSTSSQSNESLNKKWSDDDNPFEIITNENEKDENDFQVIVDKNKKIHIFVNGKEQKKIEVEKK